MKVQSVNLEYKPHAFQVAAHDGLSRFSVLVCHRRWGKTVFAVMELILAALEGSGDWRGAYIAPFRKQAKDVAWDYIKRYSARVPGVSFNETELTATLPHGARITLYGTDNAESLRGLYLNFAVLDEVADMKPNVWGEIIRPTLSDRRGSCLFIGTPKGMNLFFELFNRGRSSQDGWSSHVFRASDTVGRIPWMDDEELAAIRQDLSPAQYRQEMECDFNSSSESTLITLDLIDRARGKSISPEVVKNAPLVYGVDVARYGGDACVIVKRRGLLMYPCERFVGIGNMDFASVLHHRISADRPAMVFIDSGQGQGVIDRLIQLRTPAPVIEIAFGGRAHLNGSNGYMNRRAEMWDLMRKWFEEGGAIPNDYELTRELAAPTFSYDANNRLQLERKEQIKERMGFSPDRADALALTFAEPVSADFGNDFSGVKFFARDELEI